jgi:hypothetical protein
MKYGLFKNPITIHQAVEYELCSSWWASWISNPSLQELSALYFVWKAKRKFRIYERAMKRQQYLINLATQSLTNQENKVKK